MPAPILSIFFIRKLKKAFSLREPMRSKKLTPFSGMKTCLVLFDASDEQNSHIMFSIIKEIQDAGKNVRAVGHVPFKNNPHWCFPKISYDYLNKRNISITGIPKGEFVNDLLEMQFDLLLDFLNKPISEMMYISALANAGLKISRNISDEPFYQQIYDILIDHHELADKDYFTELKKYLQVLQKGQQ
jgi:hypothetical protein